DNNNGPARLGLGEGALGEGAYTAARVHFQAVAASAPDNARAHQGIGLSYLLAGDLANAEPALRQAVTMDTTLWRSWNGLGVIADARGDWTAADEAYGQAITAAPQEAIIYNNLGLSRLQRGEHASAIEAFDVALRLRPSMTTAVDNRRVALAMTGQYDAALAGVSDTDLAAALNNVAVIAARRGDRAIADRLFAAAVTASPRYYELAARNREAMTGMR
ncbi:MAG: tetratricopeptide repeat protein, partial [Hyphomonadaceae bacterium]|nr:tetratricopeptide repeat protein [Hyphomonadaceae bacterium]